MTMNYWCNVPKRYQEACFETFIPHSDSQDKALNFLYSHKASQENNAPILSQNVIITGPCGTGKTHLGFSYLRANTHLIIHPDPTQYYQSHFCFMTSLKEILDEIKDNIFHPSAQNTSSILQKAISSPVLILDEVGVQYGTQMERIELFNLFNSRYNEMKPIILLTNLDKKALLKLLGQRICRRLFSGAQIFEFHQQDIYKEHLYDTTKH